MALNFGGGVSAIMSSIGCTSEEAETIIKNYEEGFKGTAEFAKKGLAFVKSNGYVLMNPKTGHKMWWWDWQDWKDVQETYSKTPGFWDNYKACHKGTNDSVERGVKTHFKALAKWGRMVRNAPTQGTCCIMLKSSQTKLFNWVVDNNHFGEYLLCNLVHDECLWECPKEDAKKFAKLIEQTMLETAAEYCKSIPIPAEAETAECWIH